MSLKCSSGVHGAFKGFKSVPSVLREVSGVFHEFSRSFKGVPGSLSWFQEVAVGFKWFQGRSMGLQEFSGEFISVPWGFRRLHRHSVGFGNVLGYVSWFQRVS